MAEIQRRATSATELGNEKRERRKSGIFFFNRSFKKSPTSPKGETESDSRPTTPTLGSGKDGIDLRRTDSARSTAALVQTLSLGQAAQINKSPEEAKSADTAAPEANPTEDLPTPPDTPGPSTGAPTTHENADEAGEQDVSDQVEALESDQTPQEPNVEAEPELPQVKKITFHQDADLDVKVREASGEDAVFSVRSAVLSSASRVWKQSTSQTTDHIDMASDPAFGLNVIFSIAHYKFHDLPEKVDVGELYDVAVAAEKYQTIHLLVPFVKDWLATVDLSEATAASRDKTLVAGWVLGQAQWFSQTISQCAYNASVGTDGTLLDSDGNAWNEKPVSSEVVDLIAAVRLDAIDHITQVVSGPVSKLLNPQSYPGEDIRYCHAQGADESIREECEQLQLGSAIMGLTKARLWPPPEASRVTASPVELARTYTGVRMRRYQTPGLRFLEGEGVEDVHAQCGFGHQCEIEKILTKPAQLTASVAKELQTRAKTSGVYSEGLFEDLKEYVQEEVTPSSE